MQQSVVGDCFIIVNQFERDDDCSHGEFIKGEDSILASDENASDDDDDEVIAARQKVEHYTKEQQEFQQELSKNVGKIFVYGNDVKGNDDGYDLNYWCNNDEGSPYFYDESEANDGVKSMKMKKPQR